MAATTLALVLIGLAAGAGPARAAFPGTNGKIAFDDRTQIGEARISTVNPDGGGLTELTDLADSQAFAGGPVWSPDGTRLTFWSLRDGNVDVFVMGADGSGQRRLTNPTTGSDYAPAWSPDGTKIAFGSSRYYDDRLDNDASLYIMSSDGTGQAVLINGPDLEGNPNWQPVPRCTLTGTQGNDKLRGTTAKDVVCGLAGNDAISGAEGDDILIGGKGDDILYGGAGNDTLNGGPGTDTASYMGAVTAIEASLATGFATGQGSDVFVEIEDLAR